MKARFAGLAVLLLAGCDDLTVSLPTRPAAIEYRFGERFDPANSGDVAGEVSWVGEPVTVPPLTDWRQTPTGMHFLHIANPNAVTITADRRIVGATVWLEGVDPATARPWDRPPVRVTATRDGVFVAGGRTGFVRVGDSVTIASESDEPLGVRGRGAAFFTAMLPDRGTTTKTFDRPGRVELTSAANLHWAVADLFVCDHPYHATTDAAGRFHFSQVPAGTYQLVVRVPNWQQAGHDRDPETGAVSRTRYAPAVEVRQPVTVGRGNTTDVRLSVPADKFLAR